MPYADAGKPDYIRLLRYSDLDALVEMHAHIRTLNPANPVRYCIPGELSSEDCQSHLIAIGGIDWNALTRIILDSPALPVRQVADWTTSTEVYFEVDENGIKPQHRAVLRNIHDEATLSEDVALFARCGSPFNRHRTVTICCAMYAPGTTGAVLALTDKPSAPATSNSCARDSATARHTSCSPGSRSFTGRPCPQTGQSKTTFTAPGQNRGHEP